MPCTAISVLAGKDSRFPVVFLVLAALFVQPGKISFASEQDPVVYLATTTSTENSGLIEYLLPVLETDTGYLYRVIAVGTGKALQMGRAGDVDILLVHARDSELEFVEEGYGVDRKEVMYNDFVVVGPKEDPARIAGSSRVHDAFEKIGAAAAMFVSRGDHSGTHDKEMEIWKAADREPEGNWYREVGQGMGKTLQIASELGAYTIADRGTWIFTEEKLALKILFQDDERLFNQYSVITINPALHDVNHGGAQAFTRWITSAKGQKRINEYKINEKKLFHANAE
ncbi:MAG: substrate-binding domain-containing protein [Gammaproteobacteria bacterium]|nr:substrate-binding domain-containing protein [Gammaproteobacteria bacterium]